MKPSPTRRARLYGAIFVALGSVALYVAFDSLHLQQPYPSRAWRPFVTWPAVVGAGLFLLVMGYPTNAQGRAPRWWKIGLVLSAAAAAGIGLTAASAHVGGLHHLIQRSRP